MPSSSAIAVNGLPPKVKEVLDRGAKQHKKEKAMAKACYYRLWVIGNSYLAEGGITPEEFGYWTKLILTLKDRGIGFMEITANIEEVINVCRDSGQEP